MTDDQALEIKKLKIRVKKLEKKKRLRTPQLKIRLLKVWIESSAEKSLGDQEDTSNQGRNIAKFDQDDGISFNQEDAETQGRYGHDVEVNTVRTSFTTANINITTAEPITTVSAPVTNAGVSISIAKPKPSESGTRPIVPPQQQLNPKDKGKGNMVEQEKPLKKKDQIAFDEEVARRLEAQLQAELEEEEERGELTIKERSKLFVELIDKRKKHFAKLRAEEIRRKPPNKAQKRNQMCTYLRNMANYKHSQLKNKRFEEIQKMFNKEIKRVNIFVDMDSEAVKGSKSQVEGSKKRIRNELDEESVKRQKLEDDAEKAELKACLEIVPKYDEVVNVESLATKYPIVD
ncbi:hypothetical protein Tco_0065039 [Tanacetum coccineum]